MAGKTRRKRLLFIYNPKSGRGLIRANLAEIIETFSHAGYEVIVHPTNARMDGARVAESYARAGDCDLIACAGGDGTLDEIAGSLMLVGSDIPLGYIPTGSTNDFGYSLGISNNILDAAQAVVTGRVFPCDIASFNDRYFTYTAAFGLFSDVSYDTPQDIKNALGHAAYILNGAAKLSQLKKYHAKVVFGDTVWEDTYLVGMVVSSNSVGGFRGITGDGVRLDDGEHELMLIRAPRYYAQMGTVLNEVMTHKQNGKYLKCAKVREVHFEFDEETPWALDGEFGGSSKVADIKVIQKGINYIVP